MMSPVSYRRRSRAGKDDRRPNDVSAWTRDLEGQIAVANRL